MAVDVDADVDAAEIGGIEADFEAAVAAAGAGGDFHRQPLQGHGTGRGGEPFVEVDWDTALDAIKAWTADPDAKLPSCEGAS